MKRPLLLLFTSSIIYLTLSGNSNGPSGTPTGVQTAKTGCGGGGCHGAQITPTSFKLQLVESGHTDTVSDGKYKPGAKYTVSFTTVNSTAAKFGFIMLVTDAANNQAGVLANPLSSPQFKITTKGQYKVAEHPTPQNEIAGGFGTAVEWTAPAKGKGAVTINVAVNGCNGNGNADAGDKWALKSLTLNEGFPVSVDDIEAGINVAAYPNPAVNTLNVAIKDGTSDTYQYSVYSLSGAVSATGQLHGNINSLDVSALSSGVHFLKITNGSEQKIISFNKL